MLMIPWVLVLGISTFIFNHGSLFEPFRGDERSWTQLWEKPYQVDLPEEQGDQLALGKKILEDNGITGAFNVRRAEGGRLNINLRRFWDPLRITYLSGEGKLVAEERDFSWVELLTRLHVRHGMQRVGFLYDLWTILVDLACVAILVWIATGLYMWWKLPSVHKWGWMALGGGFLSFVGLLLSL